MNEILLANLFFIITGSAVLVVGTFVCVLCYHLVKLIARARSILAQVETSAALLVEDARALRARIGDYIANGTIFGTILTAVAHVLTTAKRTRTPKRMKKDNENEEQTEA